MSKIFLFKDGPNEYKDSFKYYVQGSSPNILKKFIKYLEANESNIYEINASLYLYNNPVLHKFLEKLSLRGIKINIISIPLEGYDADKPQKIIDIDTNLECYKSLKTKFDMAVEIYTDIKNNSNQNYNLYIFPHMYLRSKKVKLFSRGSMPYSLHIKSFYIKFKNGSGAIALTSSNLAVRDKIKDELMIIVDNKTDCNQSAQFFFEALLNNSISINSFEEKINRYNYSIEKDQITPTIDANFYTAPFFNNSQDYAENLLINLIKKANDRIYICAQHISAYEYNYNRAYKSSNVNEVGYEKRRGFLAELLNDSKKDVEIKLLSQTFVDENKNSPNGCRRPQNVFAFSNFIKDYNITEKHSYGVNSSVHGKFIIVDDIAVITSCNFTPTQFLYLDNVNIYKFDNNVNLEYSGIHSEVGQYIVLKNRELCDRLIMFFENIWNRDDTYRHTKNKEETKLVICSQCNSSMSVKNGRYGHFYGCTKFPQCTNTQKI